MLTEAEKKWLEERERTELTHGLYSCAHCWHCTIERDLYHGYCTASEDYCLIEPDFRDAAEFEARVAAKLAYFDIYRPCADDGRCIELPMPCQSCRIKHARLAVEAEMEQEEK